MGSSHQRNYDVISIFQYGGYKISNLLDGTPFEIYLHTKMSLRHLNPWLRYYYFRFLKTTAAILEFYFRF